MSSGKSFIFSKVFSINLTVNNFLLKLLEIFHIQYEKAISQPGFRIVQGRVLHSAKQHFFVSASRPHRALSSKHTWSRCLTTSEAKGVVQAFFGSTHSLKGSCFLMNMSKCIGRALPSLESRALHAHVYPCEPAESVLKRRLSPQCWGQGKSESMSRSPDDGEEGRPQLVDHKGGENGVIHKTKLRALGGKIKRRQLGSNRSASWGAGWNPVEWRLTARVRKRGYMRAAGLLYWRSQGGGEKETQPPLDTASGLSAFAHVPSAQNAIPAFCTSQILPLPAMPGTQRDPSSVRSAPSSSPPNHLLPCTYFIPWTQQA